MSSGTLVDMHKEMRNSFMERHYREEYGINLKIPMRKYGNAVVLGRFQPLHLMHEELIDGALSIADIVLVVIGSSFEAQTLSNPFTYDMRKTMIESRWPEEVKSGRLLIAGMQDYTYRNDKWSSEFEKLVTSKLGRNYIFYTFAKDKATAEYINDGLPKTVERVYHKSSNEVLHATDIRNNLFSGIPCLNIAGISGSVGFSLHRFKVTPEYRAFTEELAAIERYKKSWSSAPFPPHFVAVDALVTWNDRWNRPHILVGVRKSEFGNGKWALPGGYLEAAETLLESAKRELLEETSLAIDPSFSLYKVATFDDPARSKRGRMITHVHCWYSKAKAKPIVKAGDDLSEAFWLPIDEIYPNKTRFFSDHYPIIAKLIDGIEDFDN